MSLDDLWDFEGLLEDFTYFFGLLAGFIAGVLLGCCFGICGSAFDWDCVDECEGVSGE